MPSPLPPWLLLAAAASALPAGPLAPALEGLGDSPPPGAAGPLFPAEQPWGQGNSASLIAEPNKPVPGTCLPRPRPWPPGCGTDLVSEDDWLRRWLASLEVHIPDTSTTAGGFEISVSQGVCRHFEIEDVTSQRTDDPGFDLGVTGLRIFCQLHWEAFATALPSHVFRGEVVAEVSDSSAGGPVAVVADDGDPPLPVALKSRDCRSDIRVTNLEFSGSTFSGALHLLRGVIRRVVNAALVRAVCTNIEEALATKASPELAKASEEVRRFLKSKASTATEPEPLPTPEEDFVSLGGNSGVKLLRQLINGALGNSESAFNLNVFLGMLLGKKGKFDAKMLPDALPVRHDVEIENVGRIAVTLASLQLEGLDNWGKLDLAEHSPYELGLGLRLDDLKVRLMVKMEVQPDTSGPLKGQTLTETFTVETGVGRIGGSARLFAALNGTRLGGYAFNQLPEGGCLGQATQQVLMTQAGFELGGLSLSLVPSTNAKLEKNLDELFNLVVSVLFAQFGPAVERAVDHFAMVSLRDIVNENVERAFAELSTQTCPAAAPTYAAYTVSDVAFYVSVLLLAAALALFFGLCAHQTRERASRVLPSNNLEEAYSTTSSVAMGSFAEGSWDCLAFHPRTSPKVRWVLPCLILANLALFVSSNTVPGTNIMFSLMANGEEVAQLPALKQYTLISSIKDMADAGVWALVVLIIVFSGAWPYVKLSMMMGCWFLPTRLLSIGWRQRLLSFLDAYGKWSLIDMFIMIIMMVAFKFDLTDSSLPLPLIPEVFKSVNGSFQLLVWADPKWGIHSFVLATLSSLLVGHMVSGCHRYAHQIGEYGVGSGGGNGAAGGSRSRLCNKLRPPGALRGLLFVFGPAATLCASSLLVLIGLTVESFQFTFQGLSGLLLGEEGRMRKYSVLTLALDIPQSQPDPSLLSLKWLQYSFAAFTMVIALAYPILLVVLWCAPLTDRTQRRLLVSAEVMNAWSSLEVLVVSLGASVMEIERFALAILGHACDPINAMLQQAPQLVEEMNGYATCFDVTTELEEGYWILVAAVLVEIAAGNVVLHKCSDAFCRAAGADFDNAQAAAGAGSGGCELAVMKGEKSPAGGKA